MFCPHTVYVFFVDHTINSDSGSNKLVGLYCTRILLFVGQEKNFFVGYCLDYSEGSKGEEETVFLLCIM